MLLVEQPLIKKDKPFIGAKKFSKKNRQVNKLSNLQTDNLTKKQRNRQKNW